MKTVKCHNSLLVFQLNKNNKEIKFVYKED